MDEVTNDPSIHPIIQGIVESSHMMPTSGPNKLKIKGIPPEQEPMFVKQSLQLANELVKELVKKIENFTQRARQACHGVRFTWKEPKPEERMEKKKIIHQIKNLMPEGMLLLNGDLPRVIFATRDQQIFKSFVEKLTEALKKLKSAERSQQLLHRLLSYVKELEWMEDELDPLLLAMVEKASTSFEIQKFLEILQNGSKQLTPKRVRIINALKRKIQQTPGSRELKTQFVHLIDRYIAEILNILANQDDEHRRLKKQLLALPQLINKALREWQFERANSHWDNTLCDIAEELKQCINQRQQDGKAGDAPVIPPKMLGEAISAMRKRISNPEMQRKFESVLTKR
ncbi:MAG: hypothetical protein C5B47_01505 [Verrucomicrobia bacterium]|nr:MAG: hypothetical protein C5B47_01505 [Verrucomicrobiota bacterium]